MSEIIDPEKEKEWFENYVNSFIQPENNNDDNKNLNLKREHSLKVADNMKAIAEYLDIDNHNTKLAYIIGLFHDIGRFIQFYKHNTFSDSESVYHGNLGIEVFDKYNKFSNYPDTEQMIIRKAVYFHGLPEIGDDLNKKERLFSEMIRDADKLDIYRIVKAYYREMLDGNRNPQLELGLSDEEKISSKVIDDFYAKKIILKKDMNYLNDFKVLQIAWIFDLNFNYTKKRILDYGYIESIAETISVNLLKHQIRDFALSYLKNQVNNLDD